MVFPYGRVMNGMSQSCDLKIVSQGIIYNTPRGIVVLASFSLSLRPQFSELKRFSCADALLIYWIIIFFFV